MTISSKIVNLNKARKAQAKTHAAKKAKENRIRFGLTKAEKTRETEKAAKCARVLEAHRLTPDKDR